MKLRILLLTCAVMLVSGTLAAAVTLTTTPSTAVATVGVSSSTVSTGYIVQSRDGKIGVYSETNSNLEQVLDIDLTSLPETEQQRLDAGIHVKSHDELLKLIENFES